MTATNHALTGAVIALAVKRPELAIPLAFASHFLTDMIPHYNPPGMTRHKFKSYADSWNKKMRNRTFKTIFSLDMTFLLIICIVLPFLSPADVSPLTVLLSVIAAISPDFIGGFQYLISFASAKSFKHNRFNQLHIRAQLVERPWGMYVELAWATLMLVLLNHLTI